MIKYIFIFLLIILLFYKFKNHIKIKFKTFFQKGFFKTSKPYGVYCYCGKQGKGKTYSVVEFLLDHKDCEIYSNINSIKGINYTYINGFNELLSLRDKTNCIIVFDEIFTILQKSTKINGDVLDFLSQMRKREMIFITTAQEWLEINITLRRYCRYQIDCDFRSLMGYPILIKTMRDAEKMKWDNLENDYVAPIIETTISHGLKKVINAYDTFEVIGEYSKNNNVSYGEKNDVVVPPTHSEEQQTSLELSDYYTTTNSNRIVNSQFTDTLHINNDIKLIDTSANFDNIDNDFWDNINDSDFDESVK